MVKQMQEMLDDSLLCNFSKTVFAIAHKQSHFLNFLVMFLGQQFADILTMRS